jgi:hypothetical protein
MWQMRHDDADLTGTDAKAHSPRIDAQTTFVFADELVSVGGAQRIAKRAEVLSYDTHQQRIKVLAL